jgi:hypothetical protein
MVQYFKECFCLRHQGFGVMSDATVQLLQPVVGTNTVGSYVTHDISPRDGDSLPTFLDCSSQHTWLITKEDFISLGCLIRMLC